MINYPVCADPDARQGVSHAWCMTCGMRSQEAEDGAAVKDWWREAGRPGIERFGLTVRSDGEQLAWLDDPEDAWPV